MQLPGTQFAVGHGHPQHRRVALDVPAVLQPQRRETRRRSAGRSGGGRAGRGTARPVGGRSGGRSRCSGTWRNGGDSATVRFSEMTFRPAVTSEMHSSVRTRRSGMSRVSLAPIQMPGIEPISRAPSSDQSTWPSEAWPMPATRVSGTAWAMSVPTTRCDSSRGYSSMISVAPMAPAPIELSDTSTPSTRPHSRVSAGLRGSGIQRSSRRPTACQACAIGDGHGGQQQGDAEREGEGAGPALGQAGQVHQRDGAPATPAGCPPAASG